MRSIIIIVPMIGTLACGGGTAASPAPVESILRDSSGVEVGRVTLRERGERVLVDLRVMGLSPGEHGLHLHAVGLCEPPAFTSAGGHYNPRNFRHGHRNPQGPHLGDLGNLFVSSNGRGAQISQPGSARTQSSNSAARRTCSRITVWSPSRP